MAKRKIIKIDEAKCNGCGLCVPNCAEGAIRVVNGKARLVSELLCDGLGACLGHCPNGAITIEERETPCACPGSMTMNIDEPRLSNWPVQIKLVNPSAPFLNGADLLVAADCVSFAYADFHEKLLRNKVLIIGCPKLDDLACYRDKIAEILSANDIKSITYARMEVPCCSGLTGAIEDAIRSSGKKVPFTEKVIGIRGEVLR